VRVGGYAVVDGVEHEARFSPGSAGVGLVVPGDEPCPDGFVADERFGWWRKVPWSSVSRIVEVDTWARDADGYVLRLIQPPHGGVVGVSHTTNSGPYADVPPGHPSYLRNEQVDAEWVGTVPVDSLPDVREVAHERSVAEYSTPRPRHT
jgi:hypothetical protein